MSASIDGVCLCFKHAMYSQTCVCNVYVNVCESECVHVFLWVCAGVAPHGETHPRASLCEEAGRVCVMRTWRGVGGGDVSHLMVALSSRPSSSTAAIWQRNRKHGEHSRNSHHLSPHTFQK